MINMNIEDYLIFEFDQRYKLVTEMKEGKGYWVKCINNGIIELIIDVILLHEVH